MSYQVYYTVRCHQGRVRKQNQDNFWCAGHYLPGENNGLSEPLTGLAKIRDYPVFAVFDGMGGEQQGEQAAYIAADTFHNIYRLFSRKPESMFLRKACLEMNAEICAYADLNHVPRMGSTAVLLLFGEAEVYVCNLGDSRIYQFSGGYLRQLSQDHSISKVAGRKPFLTQHLGIRESEFSIEPYLARGAYRRGDRYLLCSDGLTDMVNDEEIAAIMARQRAREACADALLEKALERGGVDNITIILCELGYRASGFFQRWKNRHQ